MGARADHLSNLLCFFKSFLESLDFFVPLGYSSLQIGAYELMRMDVSVKLLGFRLSLC